MTTSCQPDSNSNQKDGIEGRWVRLDDGSHSPPGGATSRARSSHQPQRSLFRHCGDHPALVICTRGSNTLRFGNPILVDETLEAVDPDQIQAGDIVGIGIHTANALRGYKIGKIARDRGAYVVFGGIHATLYPAEAHELGGANAVVKGDGDVVWSRVLSDCSRGRPLSVYEGGRIEADAFLPARVGPRAAGKIHVGLGPNCAGLPQALLILLRLADRRSATPSAFLRCRACRNSSTQAVGISLHRPCR